MNSKCETLVMICAFVSFGAVWERKKSEGLYSWYCYIIYRAMSKEYEHGRVCKVKDKGSTRNL